MSAKKLFVIAFRTSEMLKKTLLNKKNLIGSSIFNVDETNFKLCPEKSRVLAKISAKMFTKSNKQTQFPIIVMFTFSDSGNS